MMIPGFTSTGSKRPEALFGPAASAEVPARMVSSAGATVVDDRGRSYLDFVMALGAVSLGYGHPAVTAAAVDAVHRGTVGSLAPIDEERLAAKVLSLVRWADAVRFLKTGAEGAAAAIRVSRVLTGRTAVLGCGYHGWLDSTSEDPGVPPGVRADFRRIPFNDVDAAIAAISERADQLAAVIVEPVIDGMPSVEWLTALRAETERCGAVLIFDEIKTGFRVAIGGAVERWGVVPDLAVYGKALGNGFPIAAVAGVDRVMEQFNRTWISSTLATEYVALAAADAALTIIETENVPLHLAAVGGHLLEGFRSLAADHPDLVLGARGIPGMSHLEFATDEVGSQTTVAMARRGILFKRTAYNFVSLAHRAQDVDRCLEALAASLEEVRGRC